MVEGVGRTFEDSSGPSPEANDITMLAVRFNGGGASD